MTIYNLDELYKKNLDDLEIYIKSYSKINIILVFQHLVSIKKIL